MRVAVQSRGGVGMFGFFRRERRITVERRGERWRAEFDRRVRTPATRACIAWGDSPAEAIGELISAYGHLVGVGVTHVFDWEGEGRIQAAKSGGCPSWHDRQSEM